MESKQNDEHSKCPTCGQLLVPSDVDPGSGKDKRSKGRRIARARRDSVQVAQRTGDDVSDATGRSINVSIAFRGGSYAGQARVVRVGDGWLNVVFPWRGMDRQIQISKSEVIEWN